MAEAMAAPASVSAAPTAATLARGLALLVPAVLLAGAFGSQYLGHLFPCEMCWWQRYAHLAALALAVLAFTGPAASTRSRALVLLAAAAIAVSRRDRRLPGRRRAQDLRGLQHLHHDRSRQFHRRAAEADHGGAAGPLRRGAMVVPRHLHGGLERHRLARGAQTDRLPERCGTAGHEPLAPRRPASRPRLDAARRPGRRIWRDPHLCRPARRASPQLPGGQARRANGRSGTARTSPASMP